jgi:D-arabinose 1-dehydrogenase-like Zn-dependent alcohol dehydrogenase
MVIGAASTPEKQQAARALGADHTIDYREPGWSAQVYELTGGRGVDIVLEIRDARAPIGSRQRLSTHGQQAEQGRLCKRNTHEGW